MVTNEPIKQFSPTFTLLSIIELLPIYEFFPIMTLFPISTFIPNFTLEYNLINFSEFFKFSSGKSISALG